MHDASPALMNQRKAILYGHRMRETPEEANEKEIRREIRALLPELFGGMSLRACSSSQITHTFTGVSSGEPLTTMFWQSCDHLLSSPRYEQVKTLKQWFLPVYKKFLYRSGYTKVDVLSRLR